MYDDGNLEAIAKQARGKSESCEKDDKAEAPPLTDEAKLTLALKRVDMAQDIFLKGNFAQHVINMTYG